MICERRESLVVVGNGTAAARVVAEVLARSPRRFTITVFDPDPVDASAAWYERQGVRLHAGVAVRQIDRARRVAIGRPAGRSFELEEPYDCLVLTQPCPDLARSAELDVGQTVVVDEQLRASDPVVFALGAAAEHGGAVHDHEELLCEQARVLADVLTGKNLLARYEGERLRRTLDLLGGAIAVEDEDLTSDAKPKTNKIEQMKQEKDGLDALQDILAAAADDGQALSEDDKQRFKWHGLFWRKQTPGHYMLRIRLTGGAITAQQLRVLADLSDEYGKGFTDLTTRQQIQLRWFTIANVPDILQRLEAVGLTSKQTGMDNVRGVCVCPLAGLSPTEALDASSVARELTDLILDNREFTNLPRKFNVTITGCTENCCHTETQDIALVPARRLTEVAGLPYGVIGFNLLVGGKQGSGGYEPATPLDVFLTREEAAEVCGHVIRIFRDHGAREQRTRARLHFLVADRGAAWFRAELEKRVGRKLERAGLDLRGKKHTDHLGIHPQRPAADGSPVYSCGLLVPVGRITTAQMRGVADLAERYGSGDVRVTVQQNLLVPNVPEAKLAALKEEPLLKELEHDPSPVMRGLVSCVGSDYCHFALIETKGWAIEVARELDKRTKGKKVAPLSIHWSGCPAGCGLHQVGTIGLQGCRSRVNGKVVDAAHVYVNGKSGPQAQTATDLMYDVPCDQLADALELLVTYLPR